MNDESSSDCIEACRREIDGLDSEIAALLDRRLSLSAKIGRAKAKSGAPLFDMERESAVLSGAVARASAENRGEVAEAMCDVIALSRRKQIDLIHGGPQPLHCRWCDFTVRMSEIDAEGRVRPSAVCGFMQDVATTHATELGVGMPLMTESNHSWMLSRLTVDFRCWPKWGETVSVKTWPSGVRGRLLALRDFLVYGADGRLLAAASSEWLFIDVSTGKIVRLTPEIIALAPEGTPRAPVEQGEAPDPKAGLGEGAAVGATIAVRHTDADVNRHANHLRLIDWLGEDSPGAPLPRRLDIVFRMGAMPGDTVQCEVARAPDGVSRHRLVRASDGTTLAVATVK